jgi:hypothetical protein
MHLIDSVVMLKVVHAECHYAECCDAFLQG